MGRAQGHHVSATVLADHLGRRFDSVFGPLRSTAIRPEEPLGRTVDGPIKIGTRLRIVNDVDRFPHFVARAGLTGVVTLAGHTEVVIRLDEPLPGAEEWDNCVIVNARSWGATDLSDENAVATQMRFHFEVI